MAQDRDMLQHGINSKSLNVGELKEIVRRLTKGARGKSSGFTFKGVRNARFVPPDECERCIMTYLDHSLGGIFPYNKVCLKDMAGVELPPKLRKVLVLELHTIFPNIKIAEMIRISRERVRQILVEAGLPPKKGRGMRRILVNTGLPSKKGRGKCIICDKPISSRNLYCSECFFEHRKQVYREQAAQPERKKYRRDYFKKRYADPEYRKRHLAQCAEYRRRKNI